MNVYFYKSKFTLIFKNTGAFKDKLLVNSPEYEVTPVCILI